MQERLESYSKDTRCPVCGAALRGNDRTRLLCPNCFLLFDEKHL